MEELIQSSSPPAEAIEKSLSDKKFPVVEVFGPTIQGEGPDQGMPCYFIRLGGCDFKCSWCDSPHAVLPEYVRRASRMNVHEIMEAIRALPKGPRLVVLSGGNPALHNLSKLVRILTANHYLTSVETQGSVWKGWMLNCSRIVVSPKPPSSGEQFKAEKLVAFMRATPRHTVLKVVVFDQGDYEFARLIRKLFPNHGLFLSAGNDAGATVAQPDRKDERSQTQVQTDLLDRGRWLANRVMVDPAMQNVKVQMQSHVLLWGNERGR